MENPGRSVTPRAEKWKDLCQGELDAKLASGPMSVVCHPILKVADVGGRTRAGSCDHTHPRYKRYVQIPGPSPADPDLGLFRTYENCPGDSSEEDGPFRLESGEGRLALLSAQLGLWWQHVPQ